MKNQLLYANNSSNRRIGNFLLVLLAIICLPAKSQCEEYNLCVSYNKQLIQRTPNLSQNKSYALHGIWYSDSIAVNQTILTETNLSGNKCVIVKIDTKGKIIAQADLILPLPYSTPNLRFDPKTGGLVYVLSVYNKIYKINNNLSVNATNKSIVGIVRIDSNLSNIDFVKIAETKTNKQLWEGENDIHCDDNGANMMILVNQTIQLNNGDSITPKSSLDIYSLHLDRKLTVENNNLLAQNCSEIATLGMANTPNGFYYFFKFYNSITIPKLNKTHLNALRKTIPGAGLDGYDILAIKEVNGQVHSSYAIGCPSTVSAIGIKSKFYFANERFYFPLNNAGKNLYDDQMHIMSCTEQRKNALAIFDTLFTLKNLRAFEDQTKYTNVRMGFFQTSENELILTGSSDSSFEFNGVKYKPKFSSNPTFLNVIYTVNRDSITYRWSQTTENHKCLFTDFTTNSTSFNLFTYPNKTIAIINGMALEKPYYPQHSWMVKTCTTYANTNKFTAPQIKCYPNPITTGYLKIESNQPIQLINVLNMNGQIVIQKPCLLINKTTLDFSNLKRGIYFIKIDGVNSTNFIKILY